MRRAKLLFGTLLIAGLALGCSSGSGGRTDGGSDAGGDATDAASMGSDGKTTDASDAGAVDAGARELWPSTLPLVKQARAAVRAGNPVCYASGWCWAAPTPLGGSLNVWSVAADDVWVVGPHGTVRRFDGKTWTNVPSPTTENLLAIWGTGPNALWMAGDDVLVHWDGTKLAVVTDAPGGGIITGGGATDLWVGGRDAPRHFDGKMWSMFGIAGVSDLFEGADGTLYGASGAALGDLIEVPPGGAAGSERYTKTGVAYGPSGVWAAGPAAVWLTHPYSVLRFDGADWRSLLSLPGSEAGPQLTGVRGVAANDVWVGADDGSMLHWNGTNLERSASGVSSPAHLAARAADDVWAAGPGGSLSRFDGQAWQRQGSGPQVGLVVRLAAVGDEIWVASKTTAGLRMVRRRADGSWQDVPAPSADYDLLSIAGSAGDDVWTVGVVSGPEAESVLAHWDGTAWTLTRDAGAHRSLWVASRDDVWMAGGDVRRWNGSSWNVVTVPGVPDGTYIYTVAGSSKTNVWVDTASRTFFQWDGTSWKDRSLGEEHLGGVGLGVVRGPADVFARVEDTGLEHFDGQGWTVVPRPSFIPNSCSARTGELWCTNGGTIAAWNGTTWAESDTLGNSCLNLVATEHDVWVGCADDGGGVLHLPR